MTVGCARCHDHKYDPIPTKDFYALTGFFNSTDEPGFYAPGRSGITPGPTMLWTDEATEREIAAPACGHREGRGGLRDRAQGCGAPGRDTRRRPALEPRAIEARPRAVVDARSAGSLSVRSDRADSRGRAAGTGAAGSLSPPPLAPESLSPRCYRHVSDVGCQTMRTGMARLVDSWSTEPLTISSSTTAGAPPAVLLTPLLRDGIDGKAFYFDDNNRGVLGQDVGYFERTQPFSVDLWVMPAAVYDEVDGLQPPRSRQRGQRRVHPPAHRESPVVRHHAHPRRQRHRDAHEGAAADRSSGRTSRSRTTDRAGRRVSRCTSTGCRPTSRSSVTT